MALPLPAPGALAAPPAPAPPDDPPHVPTRLVVRAVSPQLTPAVATLAEAATGGHVSSISGPALADAIVVPAAPGLAERLARHPWVASVEAAPVYTTQRVPNDPAYPTQWGLPAIRAPEAWDISIGSPGIRVAVLDTGIDIGHPDLAAKLDVYPDTNFVQQGQPPQDDNGHGTHVAGIIGAETDDMTAVAGTSWQARLMPVKVLASDGSGDAASVIAGLNAAVANGARVINMSFGGCDDSPSLRAAVAGAIARGVVLVAAGGNSGGRHANNRLCQPGEPIFPAAYPGVIAVAAVGRNLTHSSFSVTGQWVSLSAPGGEVGDIANQGILSTYLRSACQPSNPACTAFEIGTSQAAPFVSGAAALLLSVHPELSPADVMTWLKGTARDLGPAGVDDFYGAGLLDLYTMLTGRPTDQVLAEGATGPGFDEYVLLANPGAAAVPAQVDFLTGGGTTPGPLVVVQPGQRVTLHVNDYLKTFDVSVRVRTFVGRVVAERAMYIDSLGRVGATAGTAISETATTWYLPEGSTQPGFEEFILVANPTAIGQSVNITWQTPSGSRLGPSSFVPPLSRLTFRANDSVSEVSLAARVDATGPVVAERAVYVTAGPLAPAATDAPGLTRPATTFVFAEGATLPGFNEYLLVQNPGFAPAGAEIRFLRPGGPDPSPVRISVPGGGRVTLRVNDVRPGEPELGAIVTSDQPVLAERAMYFSAGFKSDGTAVTGITRFSRRWMLVEGSTGPGFDEWVLLANPSTTTATVVTTLLTPGGSRPGPVLRVAPLGRTTLHVNDVISEYSVSVLVESQGPPVVAERTMFIATPDNKRGSTGSEGVPLE